MSEVESVEKLAEEATSVVEWMRDYDPSHPDYSLTDWINSAPEVTDAGLQNFVALCIERRSGLGTMDKADDHDPMVLRHLNFSDHKSW